MDPTTRGRVRYGGGPGAAQIGRGNAGPAVEHHSSAAGSTADTTATLVDFNLSNLFAGADPLTDLIQTFDRSLIQFNEGGITELLFFEAYAGEYGKMLSDRLIELKAHQTPGARRSILDLAKSITLFDFLKGFNVSALGGGGK